MAVKYVKDFVFEQPRGFTGSVSHKKPPGMKKDLAPSKPFKGEYQGYAKGGMVAARGMPAAARPNAPARSMADRMESPPKVGKGQGYARGGATRRMSPAQQRAAAQEAARRSAAARPAAKAAPVAMDERVKTLPYGPSERITPMDNRPRVEVAPPRLPGPTVDMSRPAPRPVARPTRPAARTSAPSTFRGLEPGTGPKGVGPVVSGFSSMDLMYDPRSNTFSPSVIGSSNIGSQNAPYVFNPRHLKKGGMAKGNAKVAKVMGEYKRGELHSGSKKGPKVKSREQAVAIALSEARKAGAKIPKKAEGGEIFSTEYMAYGDKKGPYRGSPKKAKMLGRQDRRAREAMERAEKHAPGLSLDMPGKKMEKYAHGGMAKGGFPDLTGDGKVTRADVLKGRGVFKKGGMAVHRRKPMYGGGKC